MQEHLISSEYLGDGLIEKTYLSIELNVTNYCSLEGQEDKKALSIEFTKKTRNEDKEGNVLSWGAISSHNVLDFKLENSEQISSLACLLSCIIDNGLSKIFKTKEKASNGLRF